MFSLVGCLQVGFSALPDAAPRLNIIFDGHPSRRHLQLSNNTNRPHTFLLSRAQPHYQTNYTTSITTRVLNLCNAPYADHDLRTCLYLSRPDFVARDLNGPGSRTVQVTSSAVLLW